MPVVLLASACWSSSPKGAEPAPSEEARLQAELAAKQAENARLRQQLAQAEEERRAEPAPAAAAAAPPTPGAPDPAKTYAIAVGNWPYRGPGDAKVTLVFVHDYACRYCERTRPSLDDLALRYGNDLRIVYRPMIVHMQTAASAHAVCAAGRQGKFLDLEPILWDKGYKGSRFDSGTCWQTPAGCPALSDFAIEAKLDVPRFLADLAACEPEVRDSIADLATFGVVGTPTVYINGRYVSGLVGIDVYISLIDEEKRKADERIRKGTRKARYYDEWVIARGEKSVPRP